MFGGLMGVIINMNNIGRCVSSSRIKGKCGFIHVFTDGKRQQIFSDIKSETWENFRSLRQGDIISYDGSIFITKTGENTVRLNNLEILKRCEIGLPNKSSGVGLGLSRENPYLNLISEILSVDGLSPYRETIILRAKVLKYIREYLDNKGYVEVQTPTLVRNGFGCDAKPFKTEDGQFLRIAPELELKKLIVGGFDKIYEIGKNFRNEGLSQRHNPEFTMLEFYCQGNWETAKEELKDLLYYVIERCFNSMEVNNISWNSFRYIDTDFIEEELIQPTFVRPQESSTLAKHDKNGKAERLELYAGGIEIANLYSEQDNWEEQLEAFEKQGFVDQSYIDALKVGLPPTFGCGIGIDRLIMLLTNRNIREVI